MAGQRDENLDYYFGYALEGGTRKFTGTGTAQSASVDPGHYYELSVNSDGDELFYYLVNMASNTPVTVDGGLRITSGNPRVVVVPSALPGQSSVNGVSFITRGGGVVTITHVNRKV